MSQEEIDDIFERILRSPGPPLVIELGDGRPEPPKARRPEPALPDGDEPLGDASGARPDDEADDLGHGYPPPSAR